MAQGGKGVVNFSSSVMFWQPWINGNLHNLAYYTQAGAVETIRYIYCSDSSYKQKE